MTTENVLAGVTGSKGKVKVFRSVASDTLEDARRKTIRTLQENIEVLNGTRESANSTVKKNNNGTFAVGAKYSNTWLRDWIISGDNVYTVVHVSKEKLISTLEELKRQVAAGYADEALEEIMARNLAQKGTGR